MIEFVTLAENRLQKNRKAIAAAKIPPQIAPRDRGRADPARRLHAARRQWRRRAQAPDPGIPHQRRDHGLRERQGRRALRPRRRAHARPRAAHQAVAADRAGAAGRPTRGLQAGRASGRAKIHRRLQSLFRAQQDAHQGARCTIRCRASCWCRGSACSAWARAPRTPASPPTLRKPRSKASAMPRRSGASRRSAKPTCSISNTGRWNWPSSARAKPCRSKARSRSSPAPAAPSARPPPRFSRQAGARSGAARYRRQGRAMKKPRRSAAGAIAIHMRCHQRDFGARRLRSSGRRFRRRRYRDLECRRRLAGQDRRGRRGHACARASS